ncbi:PrsW family intramembrane metalloprotease [Candidatus Gracilibacteria bacterium]|nr:PrsW family intramembrane metalloprotease [Candidatus Gracilibacteria bacterium]
MLSFGNIFILGATVFFLCIPLIFWLFLYESFTSEYVKRRYIISGMFLGALITLPLALSSQTSLAYIFENIFSNIYIGSTSQAVFWLLSLILLAHISIFVVFGAFQRKFQMFPFIAKSFSLIAICCGLIFMLYHIFLLFSIGQNTLLSEARNIYGIIFSTGVSIFGYYIVVSILEESGKYIGHLSQSGRSDYVYSFSRFILFSISLAIGFSFFENILYTWMLYQQNGIYGGLVQIAFFRSLFSLSLHVFCTLLFTLGMWYFWQNMKRKEYGVYIKKGYILLLLGSLLTHSIFNLSLSFGYVGGVFLALVGLYFVLAYIVPRSHLENVL